MEHKQENNLENTNDGIIGFMKSKESCKGKCEYSPVNSPEAPKTSVRKRARKVEHLPLASTKVKKEFPEEEKPPASKKRRTKALIPIEPPANQMEESYPSDEEKKEYLTKLLNFSNSMTELITFIQKHGAINTRQRPVFIQNSLPALQPITRNTLITLRILMAPIEKEEFKQRWGFDIEAFDQQLRELAVLSAPAHSLISEKRLREHFSI